MFPFPLPAARELIPGEFEEFGCGETEAVTMPCSM